MFTSVRNIWSAFGVMLFLVALYLVLEHASGASTVMRTVGGQTANLMRTLQARD